MKDLVKMVHGSHLYGLNTENSDVDYKGVFLPTIDELLLNKYPSEVRKSTGGEHEKNTKDDIDEVYFSLPKFIKMACDGETIAIDMLHCDQPITSDPIWQEIRDNRSKFYSSNMKAFLGYCKKQAAKYGIKGSRLAAIEETLLYLKKRQNDVDRIGEMITLMGLEGLEIAHPDHIKIYEGFQKGDKWVDKHIFELCGSKYDMTSKIDYIILEVEKKYNGYGHRAKLAKNNEGIDWKATSHALRAAYQLKEIYETGDLKYPLRDREFLLDVKNGKCDYTSVVAPALESVIAEAEKLAKDSSYPDKVDREWWDSWLLTVYKRCI